MKRICSIIAMLLSITILTACGGANLTGRWESVDSDKYLEFFSDGTYKSDDVNYTGSYSVDGNRMRLSGFLMPDVTCTFSVSGNKLTLYNEDGEVSRVLEKK